MIQEPKIYKSREIPSELLIITFLVPQHPALQTSFRTFSSVHILSSAYIKSINHPYIAMAPTEMIQCHPPMSLPPSNTPPDSPGQSPVVILNDEQAMEMENAIAAMQVTLSVPCSHCSSCQRPPGSPPPSRATEPTPCSPTPCLTPPTNQSSSEVEFVQLAQQFLDILKSLGSNQGPPPPATADKAESEEPPTRASKLEFKTVNEVFVFRGMQLRLDGANTTHTAGTQKHTSTRSWNP
jgi:hypothetical protein